MIPTPTVLIIPDYILPAGKTNLEQATTAYCKTSEPHRPATLLASSLASLQLKRTFGYIGTTLFQIPCNFLLLPGIKELQNG